MDMHEEPKTYTFQVTEKEAEVLLMALNTVDAIIDMNGQQSITEGDYEILTGMRDVLQEALA